MVRISLDYFNVFFAIPLKNAISYHLLFIFQYIFHYNGIIMLLIMGRI